VPERTQIDESAVGNTYQELRILTQGAFVPVMVLFRHAATKPVSLYEKYFRAPVFFEQEVNAVVMYSSVLNRRLSQADPLLHKLAAAYVGEATALQRLDVAAQVNFMVVRLLPTMRCGLGDVAHRLCMHERTLQRKLKSVGLIFEDIVDKVRRSRAQELLGTSTLSMAHIAGELGYAEQASFNRSCLRWFRAAPTQAQRKLRIVSGKSLRASRSATKGRKSS
jgi:AraC-like DNA-binding protein